MSILKKFASTTLAAAVIGTASFAAIQPATAVSESDVKPCSTAPFSDAKEGSAHAAAIRWLQCEGISNGYSNGSYGTKADITRGEAAALLYRYSGDNHNAGSKRDFTDVSPGGSYFEAISWMKEEGITNGYANGSFGINKDISRGELAAFLYRMSDESFSAPSKSPFNDVNVGGKFYTPISWLHDTGMVSGYTDGTFRTEREVTRGETAAFMYALETREQGEAPVYAFPGSDNTSETNNTGGSGGAFADSTNVSWSNGEHRSNYHIYADGLNPNKPMGVVFFLHGDGEDEFDYPNQRTMKEYRAMAKEKNLLFVIPKTPNPEETWWIEGNDKYPGEWVTDLFDHLGTKYNVDLNQTYWLGFSGGADGITEQIMRTHSDGWTGGAALIMSGGPVEWGYPGVERPISNSLKANFPMHWLVGEDDHTGPGGNAGDDGYNALYAAHDGHDYYEGLGMKTTITELPDTGHADAFPKGPAYFQKILDGKM